MAEKLLKRGDDPEQAVPGSDTGLDGLALGLIPVSTLMLDKVATEELVKNNITSAWKAGGNKHAADLAKPEEGRNALLIAANDGKVYNIDQDFTTTDEFVEGPGTKYMAGTNVAVIKVTPAEGDAYYAFDVLGGTDQSVIRQINIGEATLSVLPTNSIATIPVALSAAYGVVKLDDAIDSDNGLTAGYAATPSAVKAALAAAKAYSDSLDFTYELSGELSGNTYVTTLTKKDHTGNVSATYTSTVPTALSNAAGIVKLADATDLSALDASAATAATPKAVYDALTASKAYTDALSNAIDGKIEALDYEATGMGAGKTISTLTETDGVISATFQDIAIQSTQVTDWAAAVKATANALLSANVAGATRPTTLNGTIDLLMQIVANITALSATA